MHYKGTLVICNNNFQAPELELGAKYVVSLCERNQFGVWQVILENNPKKYVWHRFIEVKNECKQEFESKQPESIPPEVVALGDELVPTQTEWTDKHYDAIYKLTEKDIERGWIKIDPYRVSKQWRLGSKDESGALFHVLKTLARIGEKNSVEREVKALLAQIKCFAEIEGIDYD